MPQEDTTDKNKPKMFQEIMGNTITQVVMWGTIGIGVIGIIFAMIALWAGSDEEKIKTAFSIIQYVFGALLPLWGTWIGTVLAYYYSKDNFESANRNVQQLVDKITSEKKLESVKAKNVMILRRELIVQTLGSREDLSRFKLKEDCIDFLNKHKIKRVVILDDADRAKYVIHRDLISYFIAEEILAGKPIAGYTLKDMYDKGTTEIKKRLITL